jgi:acetyl-CoA carboxylase biotin carboxyl carrier protein
VLKPSDVEEILRLIDGSDFQEFRLQIGDMKLELRRGGAASTSTTTANSDEPKITTPVVQSTAVEDGSTAVPAPLLGVFWHAPRPGDPPFVKAGDRVTPDSVIGIIEVMKLMNTVPAGLAGVITEVSAPNGKGVEFGQTLIRMRAD